MNPVRIPQGPLTGLKKQIPLNIMPRGTARVCLVLLISLFYGILGKNIMLPLFHGGFKG